jgi:hypothetical protein
MHRLQKLRQAFDDLSSSQTAAPQAQRACVMQPKGAEPWRVLPWVYSQRSFFPKAEHQRCSVHLRDSAFLTPAYSRPRMKIILLAFLAPALVFAAPKPLFQSKVIDEKTPNHSVEIDVSLEGAKELFLVVTDGGNGFGADWADWAEPRLVLADGSEKKLTEIEVEVRRLRLGQCARQFQRRRSVSCAAPARSHRIRHRHAREQRHRLQSPRGHEALQSSRRTR